MSEIKIDKGVPIPAERSQWRKYPWYDMEVGDSFFVSNVRLQLLASAWRNVVKKTSRRFTARSIDGGVRVWRIE